MRKFLATFSILFALTVVPIHQAHAGYWLESIIATGIEIVHKTIVDIIYELTNAINKVFQISMVQNFLAGEINSGSTASFITDYGDFLFEKPEIVAENYAEQFLTDILHGRTPGDYGYGAGAEGVLNSYEARLRISGATAIFGAAVSVADEELGVDVADYCEMKDGEIQVFGHATDVTFSCFASIFANPLNHPEGIKAAARNAYEDAKDKEEKEAATQAVSNRGALAKKDADGNVTKPAIAVEEELGRSIQIPLDAIVNHDIKNPVGAAVYQQIVKRVLQRVNKSITKEIDRTGQKLRSSEQKLRNRIEGQSPNARFENAGSVR